jgi:hypothetical protein
MDPLLNDFYVIAVITNPERYKRRPQLFREFSERMAKYGVNFYVVEGAFGDRDFEITEPKNPRHIRVTLESELWHKENLINIGITRLPSDWKYVAWIDADIDFVRPDWALETVHELQHHPVVQMFEDAVDLGPEHEILNTFKSFVYCYKNGIARDITKRGKNAAYYYTSGRKGSYWHPGYCWAATREAINTLGGLLDFAILGSADHHMACALIGEADYSVPTELDKSYHDMVMSWQDRALRLHKNVGYIKGTIYHYWHGKKANRQYKDRWSVLVDNKFNPMTDIHKDWQSVWVLYPGHEKLRDQIRDYFKARNEDSIDKV